MTKSTIQWAPDQQAIFEAVKRGKGNIAVCASPGSGKTTVLLECLNIVPRAAKTIFLSFSNSIVKELKDRIPPHAQAMTLHSLGFKALRVNSAKSASFKVEENKYFLQALKSRSKDDRSKKVMRECFAIQDICNYARMTLTDVSNEIQMAEMCHMYNIDATSELIAEAVRLLSASAKKSSLIDFIDMIYLPVKLDLNMEQFDYIFLDEAQDLNNTQRELLKKVIKPNGRLIFVGDNKQAIFGFSGADVDSFEKNVELFNAQQFPLYTTYRCSKAVVNDAKSIYEEIVAYENSPEGCVRNGSLSEVEDGDLVLCRNTKPLIAAFFQLIESNVKSFIVGKDIEKGLLNLAEKTQHSNLESMKTLMEIELQTLESQLKSEGVKKTSTHPKYISMCEKIEVLNLIMNKCDSGLQVAEVIREIFNESKKGVRLMTIHRSKGLECERVFIINECDGNILIPSKYASKPNEMKQETNLDFVARTRAKLETIYVTLQS